MNLSKHLQEKGLYCEVMEHANGAVSIEIEDGDWKHEHGYCDFLMNELGYIKTDEHITKETGDDYYSSIHFYEKNN